MSAASIPTTAYHLHPWLDVSSLWLQGLIHHTLGLGPKECLRLCGRSAAGGSVSDKNAADIASKEDVDGFLVGGASLKGETFITICNAHTAAVPV